MSCQFRRGPLPPPRSLDPAHYQLKTHRLSLSTSAVQPAPRLADSSTVPGSTRAGAAGREEGTRRDESLEMQVVVGAPGSTKLAALYL